jgi:preprotein translocase subunit SecY
MFRTISNIMKVADLRSKILFTLGILIVYRIGSFIPVPNVDKDVFIGLDQAQGGGFFGLMNTFSGGALFNFSIFAMSIFPYITASIIVQLLSMDVIPKFAEWAREGEAGRRKLAQITRYGTVVLGLIQAFGMSIGFHNRYGIVTDPTPATFTIIAIVLTAGTAMLMWLGEMITEKGIGNGISILIFAGIVAGIPTTISTLYTHFFGGANASEGLFLNILFVILLAIGVVLLIAAVIFVQQGIRKIPVQYAKRIVGRKMYGGQSTHIPMRVNAAGVIPVIFAMSIVMFPAVVASFWQGKRFANWIIENFSLNAPLGLTLYVLLIIGFTYFYTFVQINPQQMAENLKKNGGYIPGVRPGQTTVKYLTRVMNRITLAGSIFLAVVAILPVLVSTLAGLPSQVSIGGTSLLIVTGVALETMKQIESQLIKRHYKGFINK